MYSIEFGASIELIGANTELIGANTELIGANTELIGANAELMLKSVTDAIELLDASWRTADSADLEAQVAAVWEMVGTVDPELVKVAAQYV
jgi:hypothetical protein